MESFIVWRVDVAAHAARLPQSIRLLDRDERARAQALRPDAWDGVEDDDALAETLDPLYEIAGLDDDEVEQSGESVDTVAGVVIDDDTAAAAKDDASDEAAAAAADEASDDASDEAETTPIDPAQRTKLIDAMLQGVMALYDYYADERLRRLGPAAPIRRAEPKVGRNDPCPCGSGRKYKQCHGR